MPYSEIEVLLNRRIGLDPATLGPGAVERAVRRRLEACSLQQEQDYLARLLSSDAELQALVEAVVVPETWFFRDKAAFSVMAEVAVQRWLPTHAAGSLRLLSAPCATGEEPYSMAMALFDAGFPAARIAVEGWDISVQTLARARAAIYGRNSFRGPDVAFRRRHFEETDEGHRVRSPVRERVSFSQNNLLADAGAPGAYDIIFCRNVLIYLDRASQEVVLTRMRRLLTPGGLLFVGPAEAGLVARDQFACANFPKAFAFIKAAATELLDRRTFPTPAVAPIQSAAAGSFPMPCSRSSRPPEALPSTVPSSPGATSTGFMSRLEMAGHLADRGHLQEAERLCRDYLHTHTESAHGFYLLGLVLDAGGDKDGATQAYRRALYLDPNHAEALLQLAFLAEREGDKTGAGLLQERARRCRSSLKP